MKRAHLQIPEPLYEEVRRVARLRGWSIADVIRRAVEQLVAQYGGGKAPDTEWEQPPARSIGRPLVPPDRWREVLADDEGTP